MSVPCNRCDLPLPEWDFSGGAALCTECGAANTVLVFPALFDTREAGLRPEAAAEGEATCFDHPNKRAVASCELCGRFVCQLCSVAFQGTIRCPSCVVSRRSPQGDFEKSRTLYDSIALTLALAPMVLLWPITFLTAGSSLYVAIRYWRRPLSLVRRSRWRFVLAVFVALAQIGAWIWGAIYLVSSVASRVRV